MDATARKALIEAWIKFQLLSSSKQRKERLVSDEYLWAFDAICEISWRQPELAWELMLEILAQNPDTSIRVMVMAGILQDLGMTMQRHLPTGSRNRHAGTGISERCSEA